MNNEMSSLKNIIKSLFDIDIDKNVRKREFVDCRLIYSKILRDRGHTTVSIGKSLQKDHSTIVHYTNVANTLISRDESLAHKYLLCKNTFSQVVPSNNLGVSNRLVVLSSENERLLQEKDMLVNNLKRYDRLKDIIKIIEERTPNGMELVIKNKIRKMFNGYNLQELTHYERLKEVGKR